MACSSQQWPCSVTGAPVAHCTARTHRRAWAPHAARITRPASLCLASPPQQQQQQTQQLLVTVTDAAPVAPEPSAPAAAERVASAAVPPPQRSSAAAAAAAADSNQPLTPWSLVGSAIILGGGTAAALAVSSASPQQLPVAACAAALRWTFAALTVTFIGYGASSLVESTQRTVLQPLGAAANRARKRWCAALQWVHAACVAAAALLGALAWRAGPAAAPLLPLPAQAQQLLAAWWPLLVVASVNTWLLCYVELHKPLVRKARVREIDAQAPGRAHPFMVQGAQTAARLFVWTVLLAVHGALIVLGADAWGRAAAGAGVAGLAALGAAWATVEEQDSELVVPRSALPAGQQQ